VKEIWHFLNITIPVSAIVVGVLVALLVGLLRQQYRWWHMGRLVQGVVAYKRAHPDDTVTHFPPMSNQEDRNLFVRRWNEWVMSDSNEFAKKD
jgi:hypothetical protein